MRMHFDLFLRLESTDVSLRLVWHHLCIDLNRAGHCSVQGIDLVESDETRLSHMWNFWTTWMGEVSIRKGRRAEILAFMIMGNSPCFDADGTASRAGRLVS